jgi:CarD family transcriptional regulator
MQFHVGDAVFHPVHGVGHIVAVAEKQFVENQARLYYHIAVEKGTLWVPVDAQEKIGLRAIIAKREMERYRQVLKSRPVALSEKHTRYRLELAERFKRGEFLAACEIVRDLNALAGRKPLGAADQQSLRKAREGLDQEWAAAGGISVAEAAREIEALLVNARASATR